MQGPVALLTVSLFAALGACSADCRGPGVPRADGRYWLEAQPPAWWQFGSPAAPRGKGRLLLVCPLSDRRVVDKLRRELGSYSYLPPALCARPPWHEGPRGTAYGEWRARRTLILCLDAGVAAAAEAGADPRYDYELEPAQVEARLPAFLERERTLEQAAVRELIAEHSADPHFDPEVAQLYIDLWLVATTWDQGDPRRGVLQRRIGVRSGPCTAEPEPVQELLFDYEYREGKLKLAFMLSDAERSVPALRRYVTSLGCAPNAQDFEAWTGSGGWAASGALYSEDFLTTPPAQP